MALKTANKDTEKAIRHILSWGNNNDLAVIVKRFYERLVYLDHYGRISEGEFLFGSPDNDINVEIALHGSFSEIIETGEYHFSIAWFRNGKCFMHGCMIQRGEPLSYTTLRKIYEAGEGTEELIDSIKWDVIT